MPAGAERHDVDRAWAAVAGALGQETLDRLVAEGRTVDPRRALATGRVA